MNDSGQRSWTLRGPLASEAAAARERNRLANRRSLSDLETIVMIHDVDTLNHLERDELERLINETRSQAVASILLDIERKSLLDTLMQGRSQVLSPDSLRERYSKLVDRLTRRISFSRH